MDDSDLGSCPMAGLRINSFDTLGSLLHRAVFVNPSLNARASRQILLLSTELD